ncbi:MAG TPA: GNAT family N-acetyltransferase [Acetivibrio sp.]|mgnify:CR=1 FL=1|uniref:GNAT family N-acetyltransferase n=1 Tax=Acetivibrio sp. TaxID=1872092 RepID=UPI002B933943|nr:GNAT family N-acetyltransferase [Acetivibrio sp.]HOM02952.1 GNAT family N-acetyltransferase [Acetivibrio sp.]
MEGFITEALMEDLPDILNLQKKAFERVAMEEDNFNISPMTQTLENITEEYEKRLFLKYILDGKIIGSVRAHLDSDSVCHIGRLIVHPDFQNRGIGKALMKEIENRFNDCSRYEIFTGYNSKNSIALYKKLGYVETSVKDVDGVCMVFLKKDNKSL